MFWIFGIQDIHRIYTIECYQPIISRISLRVLRNLRYQTASLDASMVATYGPHWWVSKLVWLILLHVIVSSQRLKTGTKIDFFESLSVLVQSILHIEKFRLPKHKEPFSIYTLSPWMSWTIIQWKCNSNTRMLLSFIEILHCKFLKYFIYVRRLE